MSAPMRRFEIGYALEPKTQQSFIQISLMNHAKERGIDFIPIDVNKPLIDQGLFDCILHKLNGEKWKKQLAEYSLKNPNVYIIDPPDAIERLHSRVSMLEVVSELKIPQGNQTFGIPKQIVINNSETLLDPATVEGLKFPLLAKPSVANGSLNSHKMSLVFNNDGLKNVKSPIVLQEFVNHGGVIFKVYVVGEYVKCVKRKSLPDVSDEKLGSLECSLSFSLISNLATEEENDDKSDEMMHVEEVDLPPLSFITDIARGLRQAMGLHLFNFDVISDARVVNHYLIIDINYFPAFANMPSYETILTDFFWDIVHHKQRESTSYDKEENPDTDSDCLKMLSCDKEEIKLECSGYCSDGGDESLPLSSLSNEEKEKPFKSE